MASAPDIRPLANLVRTHPGCTALTGAGISTESGIPDFRGRGGLYETLDPMECLSAEALQSRSRLFWRTFTDLFAPYVDAEPNTAHLAIARLEAAGHVRAVITQNIDNLHFKAGSQNVLEVHGHLRSVHCTGCRHPYELAFALEQIPEQGVPTCPECGRMLRPDVVLFGDMMGDSFRRAIDVAARSDLILVVGSSLSVAPASSLALMGRHLVIINREPTPADDRADIVLLGSAGDILTVLAEELLQE